MRDSIVIYRSFYESIKLLPKKYQLQCFTALFEYGLNDVPFENLPGTVEAILRSFKPQVDANNRKYENGCKGGRPKNNQDETKAEPSNNQAKSKAERNDNDNVNVNVNADVNANANDNDNDNALGSSGGGSPDDEFNIWKKLDPEKVDQIYDAYPESGGLLIDEVFNEVRTKKKKVKDPVAYILGYAKNKNWDDKADHFN